MGAKHQESLFTLPSQGKHLARLQWWPFLCSLIDGRFAEYLVYLSWLHTWQLLLPSKRRAHQDFSKDSIWQSDRVSAWTPCAAAWPTWPRGTSSSAARQAAQKCGGGCPGSSATVQTKIEKQYSNENVILIFNMSCVIHYNFSVFIFPLDLFWFIRLWFLTRFFLTSPHIYDLCIFICGTVSGGENMGKLVLPIEVTRNHEILRVWCPSVSFSTVYRRKVWADLRRKQSWKSCAQANPPTPRLGCENMFLFRKMQGVPKVLYGFVPSLAYTLAPILLPQSSKWNMVLLQR